MGGKSSSEQQTQQSSQTAPWIEAQPALKGILSGITGQLGNYSPNADETGALQSITNNAKSLPDFGPQTTNLANNYIGGDPTGLLNPALQNYQSQLNPIANQNNDPMQTPGMAALLATIRGDVSNSVNGMFAGAGRDMSGMNQQALARGISQGEAAPLLAQYNQNVSAQTGAAGNLYNAAGNTASAIGGNQAQGLNFANAIPQMANAGPMGILAAQSAARGLPLQNLGMLANLTVPIAGLGGQSSGQSNTQGSQTMSGAQQFATIMGGMGSLFAPRVSHRKYKKDVEVVGSLFDGTPVYRFRYIGTKDEGMAIGLMADDVEKYAPDAIKDIGGFIMVDYQRATERALESR